MPGLGVDGLSSSYGLGVLLEISDSVVMVNVNTEELEDDDDTDELGGEDDDTDDLVVEDDDADDLVDESDTSASVEMVKINPEDVLEEDVESSGPVVRVEVDKTDDELDSSATVNELVVED